MTKQPPSARLGPIPNSNLLRDIWEFRTQFEQLCLAVIPRLLDDQGYFLAVLTMLVGVDTLAGVFAPDDGTGERFRAFVTRYFPAPLESHSGALWECRIRMVHSLHPGPFALVCGQPELHLTRYGTDMSGGAVLHLNAQDLFAASITAAQAFFSELGKDENLKANFRKRVAATDGGVPETLIGFGI
jgi:hypothetical protein